MSSAVFPGTLAAMPGLAWSVFKSPAFNTKRQTSVGNSELRASFTPYPRWTWQLKYNFLVGGGSHYETLLAFYLARQGGYDSFLYEDPSDYTVTDQSFGVGDGVTTTFQVVRSLGGFSEPIYNPNAITNIKVAGVPTGAYTQSAGRITFAAPPAAAAALAWTGTYRWRVRFDDDSQSFEEFAYNLWSLGNLSFTSILGS